MPFPDIFLSTSFLIFFPLTFPPLPPPPLGVFGPAGPAEKLLKQPSTCFGVDAISPFPYASLCAFPAFLFLHCPPQYEPPHPAPLPASLSTIALPTPSPFNPRHAMITPCSRPPPHLPALRLFPPQMLLLDALPFPSEARRPSPLSALWAWGWYFFGWAILFFFFVFLVWRICLFARVVLGGFGFACFSFFFFFFVGLFGRYCYCFCFCFFFFFFFFFCVVGGCCFFFLFFLQVLLLWGGP